MRDWKRYEEAKRLRDTGLTLKATGAVLGVSGGRVREMLTALERRERSRAWEADNPRPKPWWHGLAHRTKYELERAGFDSRESCEVFAADDLTMWRGAVVFKDSDDADWWRWTHKRFKLSMANEIRAWLGCQPFAKAPKATSAAELERARKLLERNGWRVEPPNVELTGRPGGAAGA